MPYPFYIFARYSSKEAKIIKIIQIFVAKKEKISYTFNVNKNKEGM